MTGSHAVDFSAIKRELVARAAALGFGALGVASIDIPEDERHLLRWLDHGFHGEMHYMQRHGLMRSRPARLAPGTVRVVSARMDYWPAAAREAHAVLSDPTLGYVSRYALGRDYHKILRRGLAALARELQQRIGAFGYRVCVDTAPVLEKALARDAGLGWIGKHTNLIAREAGSWFFLGEILTDLPLPVDERASAHCGSCRACIPACPTGAIVAPYRLDARRCISYLTIEHGSAIPLELRAAIGNRIYGCDDCQLVCPWNKFARAAAHPDFKVRHDLDGTALAQLFRWTAREFEERMRGSAIYRIGYLRWSRNIAVALGNAPASAEAVRALAERRADASPLVREHVEWALEQQLRRSVPHRDD
ncbi:MAG TPA: tRNA epoxyqueuosine(34) reductase QueG [Steroidobacteraceae bacterium]|jgi:epoxyqueuosine reductase|nr:tRNA epoxyqueuosine(34) reductase QueG [Steroidobacteraceae bacterium]